jgi:hypothetical protein
MEGKIRISLEWDGHTIRKVTVAPRALIDASRLVRGKRPQEAALTIPLLFSLCGRAQGVAAALALDAAQGRFGADPERNRQVIVEALQETAWRFLIDLPQFFGLSGGPSTLAALRKYCAGNPPGAELAAYLEDLIDRHLLGMSSREWRESGTTAQLDNWLAQADTPLAGILRQLWNGEENRGIGDIAQLPDFNAAQMVEEVLPALLDDAHFTSRPHWRGQPAETGALARLDQASPLHEALLRHGDTVTVRLLARLADLTRLADMLRGGDTLSQSGWIKHAKVAENAGVAWLQTSRGLLIHYAEVGNGMVTDYRIVAPTEWNFHPDGAFVCGLTGKAAASEQEARRYAELLALTLDPCVGYEIGVDRA